MALISLDPPKTFKVYLLVKQTGLSFVPVRSMVGSSVTMGTGFFLTKDEAEHNRTIEALADTTTTGMKPVWHVFELEMPNPTYKE